MTVALDTNVRLRVLVDAAEDPSGFAYTLRGKLSSDSVYQPVPTSSALTTAFGAIGAAPSATATSTIDIAYPTVAAGDLIIVAISSRLGSTSIDAEGFTALATENVATSEGTASTEGADAGGVRVTTFYKEADGTETGTVTFANTGTATISKTGRMLSFTKPWWATWNIASTTGKDVAGGTGYSAAMGADPGIAIGDILVAATAVNTDGAAYSAEDVTGTGLASALTTEHVDVAGTGGNDTRLIVTEHDVTAALTSGVPTFVATAASGSGEGATVLIRLRATGTPPFIISPSANITAGGEVTTAQLTAPAGKSTSDFTTGRMWDNENGSDSVDIAADFYTELEWCLQFPTGGAEDGDTYQFRVYAGGAALDTYTQTATVEIGSSGPNEGAVTGSIAWSGSVTGTRVSRGAASGAVTWSGAVTGTNVRSGSASGSIAWVGAATGTRTPKGAAAGTIAWAGSATGTRMSLGAASGAVTWSGAVTGTNVRSGSASGSIAWVGAATGTRTSNGFASGTITWAGSVTGEAPSVGVNDGSASGSIAWAGSVTGTRVSRGAASGAVAWTGVVNGVSVHRGASTGTVTWTGVVNGEAPTVGVNDGSASGSIAWAGTVTGARTPKAAVTGAVTWTGTATGVAAYRGAAVGSVTWTGVVVGAGVIAETEPVTVVMRGAVDTATMLGATETVTMRGAAYAATMRGGS